VIADMIIAACNFIVIMTLGYSVFVLETKVEKLEKWKDGHDN
jgi:hypothetical protein